MSATRRIFLSIGEETLSVKEVANRTGLNQSTIYSRINRGWPLAKSVDPNLSYIKAPKVNRIPRVPQTKSQRRDRMLWQDILTRCYKPSSRIYYKYGARGITVCARWMDSFQNFMSDMGPRTPGKFLSRIDCSKGYSPDNCEWASRKGISDRRSRNIMLRNCGRALTMEEVAKESNIHVATIRYRLSMGMDLYTACTTRIMTRAERASNASKQRWANHVRLSPNG